MSPPLHPLVCAPPVSLRARQELSVPASLARSLHVPAPLRRCSQPSIATRIGSATESGAQVARIALEDAKRRGADSRPVVRSAPPHHIVALATGLCPTLRDSRPHLALSSGVPAAHLAAHYSSRVQLHPSAAPATYELIERTPVMQRAPTTQRAPGLLHTPATHRSNGRGAAQLRIHWGDARWSRTQLLGEIARGSWGMCRAEAQAKLRPTLPHPIDETAVPLGHWVEPVPLGC